MGEVLEPRAWSQALDWCDDLKQRMDKCDRSMSRKPHWWQRSFFLTNSDCSSGVHRFVLGPHPLVSPPILVIIHMRHGSIALPMLGVPKMSMGVSLLHLSK